MKYFRYVHDGTGSVYYLKAVDARIARTLFARYLSSPEVIEDNLREFSGPQLISHEEYDDYVGSSRVHSSGVVELN